VLDVIGLSPRSIVADPRHPTAWLGGVLDRRCVARILAGFALLLALVPFMATFTAMKSFIGLGGFTATFRSPIPIAGCTSASIRPFSCTMSPATPASGGSPPSSPR
jgi:hypothetical protein